MSRAQENLRIYEAARQVPPEAQKSFNNGRFKGTDISPMWRIKKLTELFGPAGFGWYTEILGQRSEKHADDTVMAIVDIHLFVKVEGEWSKPIFGTGGNVLLQGGRSSDEGYKMAYTDALSVACKALGIGADVYFEKNRTKYTLPPEERPLKSAKPPQQTDKLATMIAPGQIGYIKTHTTPENLEKLLKKYGLQRLSDMPRPTASKVITQLQQREKEQARDEQSDPDRQPDP